MRLLRWTAAIFVLAIASVGAQAPAGGGQRAGGPPPPAMTLTTTSFTDGGVIPPKYTQAGDQISPALTWTNAPPGLRIKRAVHQSLGVPLVDMTPDLKPSLYLEADPVHLDVAGSQMVADKLFETLTDLVSH